MTSGGGVIETVGNANTINAVTNVGSVHVNDATTLTLAGNIANNGMIQMLSTGDQTYLQAAATGTTLSGTGTVLLTDNSHNVIRRVRCRFHAQHCGQHHNGRRHDRRQRPDGEQRRSDRGHRREQPADRRNRDIHQ